MLTRSSRSQYATLLDAAVLTAPDSSRPALIFIATGQEPVIITRDQFVMQAAAYAAALHDKGLQPNDVLVIAHLQNLECIYAFWGALLIGAIPSIFPTLTDRLDPDIYMQRMAQLVSLSGVRAIFTSDDFAPRLRPYVDCPVHSTSTLTAIPTAGLQGMHTPSPDDIVLLQHSSGTTGLQKGVALSHEAVLNQLASYSNALALNDDDVIVSWLPLYHDMGLIAGFLLPLIQGIPLVMMSPFDWVQHPALLFQAIDRYRGTLCWLPNFAYNHSARRIRTADLAGLSLGSMRAFVNCSEPVHHESHILFLDRFAELGISVDQLAVSYAMAENVFAVTQTPIGKPAKLDWIDRAVLATSQRAQPVTPQSPGAAAQVSCGSPIAGVEVKILDPNDQVLSERSVGEVAIRSNSLLTGYHRRPDLKPFTPDGWYRTGDMGYMADGELFIIGRYKDLIINAGKNVYPQDIEAIVNTVPGIHPGRAVVFGVPDEREGTELIAVVAEVDTDHMDQRHEITRQIRQSVSQQSMVTVSYVQLVGPKWLIKTSSGKIARAANREKWLSERTN